MNDLSIISNKPAEIIEDPILNLPLEIGETRTLKLSSLMMEASREFSLKAKVFEKYLEMLQDQEIIKYNIFNSPIEDGKLIMIKRLK